MPIRLPAACASPHGTPISHISGANSQPNPRLSVSGSPSTNGKSASTWSASETSAKTTMITAITARNSCIPSIVPLMIASMLDS